MKKHLMRIGLLALMLVSMTAVRADANLVLNPGFEAGTYADWDQDGDTRYMFITSSPSYVHSGTFAARFAGLGDNALLSQSLTTSVGVEYQVSYWLKGDGDIPNDFSVSFGGQVLHTDPTNEPAFPYTLFTFYATATSTSSVLQFAARDDPGYYYLDDVSVIVASVPEPSTLLMGIIGGFFVAGSVARTRRKEGT